jgi:Mrp family chromosome partitioning ATPase
LAVHLARGLAAAHCDVAVMDLSGEGTSSRALLGNSPRPGLVELLRGEARLADVMSRDRASSAQVLPCFAPAREDEELPLDRLAMLAGSLAGNFSYLVLDCGDAGPHGVLRIAGEGVVALAVAAPAQLAQARRIAEEWRAAGIAETVVVRAEAAAEAALVGAA